MHREPIKVLVIAHEFCMHARIVLQHPMGQFQRLSEFKPGSDTHTDTPMTSVFGDWGRRITR